MVMVWLEGGQGEVRGACPPPPLRRTSTVGNLLYWVVLLLLCHGTTARGERPKPEAFSLCMAVSPTLAQISLGSEHWQ